MVPKTDTCICFVPFGARCHFRFFPIKYWQHMPFVILICFCIPLDLWCLTNVALYLHGIWFSMHSFDAILALFKRLSKNHNIWPLNQQAIPAIRLNHNKGAHCVSLGVQNWGIQILPKTDFLLSYMTQLCETWRVFCHLHEKKYFFHIL